ncbi:phospholipase/carboxylesterase family protein [Xylariaceae sp. FL0594]|nr:phospholipase/carboxylesterase family protein [Xylariaceae sp. FL0594]
MSLPFNSIDIPPAQGHPHTHTVIFLHGRGDDNGPFRDSLQHWRDSRNSTLTQAFPTFRWVLPQAPMREMASYPGQRVRIWFDNWNVRDLTEREELQADGLREIIPVFRELITLEAARLGGRSDRIVIASFSQGGAAGAHLLFNSDVPLAAFMGFSCRCPFARRSLSQMREVVGVFGRAPDDDDCLRKTPVLLEHCVGDPIVPIESGRVLRDTLRGFGCQVDMREYTDGGHWLHLPTGLDDVVTFLEENVIKKTQAEDA